MAVSSLDDKFLGEKVNNYCSSSEEESESDGENEATVSVPSQAPALQFNRIPHRGKSTAQTGPKGVIEDWRHYRRLKYEEQQNNDAQRLELIKKLSLTCDPKMDKESSSQDLDEDDKEFLHWYNKKRILELQQKFAARWTGITFGKRSPFGSSKEQKSGILKLEQNLKNCWLKLVKTKKGCIPNAEDFISQCLCGQSA